jgi:hypothetical protein
MKKFAQRLSENATAPSNLFVQCLLLEQILRLELRGELYALGFCAESLYSCSSSLLP